MKRCPTCNRTYTDLSLNFVWRMGHRLLPRASRPIPTHHQYLRRETHRNRRYEIYRPEPPAPPPRAARPPQANQPPPQWSPTPHPQKKSNAIWWNSRTRGSVIMASDCRDGDCVGSMGSNTNCNLNANVRNDNRNANVHHKCERHKHEHQHRSTGIAR